MGAFITYAGEAFILGDMLKKALVFRKVATLSDYGVTMGFGPFKLLTYGLL